MKFVALFISLFLLISCGGGGSSDSNESIIESPNQDTNSESEVCSGTDKNGLIRCDLKYDNLDRYYFIYTPENLDSNKSIPVLFALHGYGSSAYRHLSCLLYTSPSPRDATLSRMPSSA